MNSAAESAPVSPRQDGQPSNNMSHSPQSSDELSDKTAKLKKRHELMNAKRAELEAQKRAELEAAAEKEAIRKAKLDSKRQEKKRSTEEHKRSRAYSTRPADLLDVDPLLRKLAAPDTGSKVVNGATEPDGRVHVELTLTIKQKHALQAQADKFNAALQERVRDIERLQKDVERARTAHRRVEAAQTKAYARLEGGPGAAGSGSARYPIDDALLAREPARKGEVQSRPPLVKTLPVPARVRGTVLKVWDFLHTFSQQLGLAPFSLNAFVEALQHDTGPVLLLGEAHSKLLQLLLRDSAVQKLWAEAVSVPSCRAARAAAPAVTRSSSAVVAVAAAAAAAVAVREEDISIVPADARVAGPTAAALVTPLTWQAVTRLLAPKLLPWTRLVSAGTAEQSTAANAAFKPASSSSSTSDAAAAVPEGSARAQVAAWSSALSALGSAEHWALSQEQKVALLDLLVEAAYSTKKVVLLLQANMTDRLQLEAQRREELARMAREGREELAAKREQVLAELKEAASAGDDAAAAAATTDGTAEAAASTEDKPAAVPAAPGKGKGKAKAAGSKKAKEGSEEVPAKPSGPTTAEINKALEHLLEQEAVGGGSFIIRDIIAEDAAVEAAPSAGSSGSTSLITATAGAAASAGDGPGSDVEDSELYLATLSRTEMMARRREKDAKSKARAAALEQQKADAIARSARASALSALTAALKREDSKALASAIRTARAAGLEGRSESRGKWVAPQLLQACKALVALKDRLRRAEVASRYRSQLSTKFVRTEPLGSDAAGRRYWVLEGEDRVFVEEVTRRSDAPALKRELSAALAQGHLPPRCSAMVRAAAAARSGAAAAAGDETMAAAAALQLGLYDAADTHPLLHECSWYYLETEEEIRDLILSLDERGVRERALKEALQERFDMAELEKNVAAEKKGRAAAGDGDDDFVWSSEGSEHIGKPVRRNFGSKGGYTTGRVTGWVSAADNDGLALWHVVHQDGDEEDLEEYELLEAAGAAVAAAAAEAEAAEAAAAAHEEYPLTSGNAAARYCNTLTPKALRTTVDDLGAAALRAELLLRENLVHRDMHTQPRAAGSNSSGSNGGGSSAAEASAVRAVWRAAVKSAAAVPALRRCLQELEELVHSQQEQPDVVERGSDAAATAAASAAAAAAAAQQRRVAQGWQFDSSADPAIGAAVRLFTESTAEAAAASASVDGKVVAVRPARSSSAEPAPAAASSKGKRKAGASSSSSSSSSRKPELPARPAKWLLQLDTSSSSSDAAENSAAQEVEVSAAALELYMRYASDNATEKDRDAEEAIERDEEDSDDASQHDSDNEHNGEEDDPDATESSEAEAEFDEDATEDELDVPTAPAASKTTARAASNTAAAAAAVSGSKGSSSNGAAAAAAVATLWPGAAARQQWLAGIQSATTVSALGLGLIAFVEAAARFGYGAPVLGPAAAAAQSKAKADKKGDDSARPGARKAKSDASAAITAMAIDADKGSSRPGKRRRS